ncbi:MAG: hypothetical protein EXX96DRAFT_590902 [Benjaminiella poitrasii]|nr:MAG: hypothetical protein EXX96DRAFT_590902 [Benjaminiella poitrasii]
MTDPITHLSRGYGFVRFLNPLEQQQAVIDMNGSFIAQNNNRPIRVSFATPKSSHYQHQQHYHPFTSFSSSSSSASDFSPSPTFLPSSQPLLLSSPTTTDRYLQLALQAPALVQQSTDPNNTTVFVGGLSSPVTEKELAHYFAPFGEIVYVKIPPNKGCGFVQYMSRVSAEQAIERMNGFLIGQSRIRLSWGRSSSVVKKTNVHDDLMLSRSLSPPSSLISHVTTTTSSTSLYDPQYALYRSTLPLLWHLSQQKSDDDDNSNDNNYNNDEDNLSLY